LRLRGIEATQIILEPVLTYGDFLSRYTLGYGYGSVSFPSIIEDTAWGFQTITDCDIPVEGTVTPADNNLTLIRKGMHIAICEQNFHATQFRNMVNDGENSAIVPYLVQMVIDRVRLSIFNMIWLESGATVGNAIKATNRVTVDGVNPLGTDDGRAILQALWDGQSDTMQGIPANEKAFYVPVAIYNRYMQDVLTGCCSEGSFLRGQDGVNDLRFLGSAVYAVAGWDYTLTNECAGLFVVEKGVQVGLSQDGINSSLDVYYDRTDNQIHIKASLYLSAQYSSLVGSVSCMTPTA
jgi:hypothetical protein